MSDADATPPALDPNEPVVTLPRCVEGQGWRHYWLELTLDEAVTLAVLSKLNNTTPRNIVEDMLRRGTMVIPISAFDGLLPTAGEAPPPPPEPDASSN